MRVMITIGLVLAVGCNADEDGDGRNFGDVDYRGGDGLPNGDAGPGDGAGGDGGPPEITLEIAPSCPTFTPCGGNEVGTWYVSAVCVEEAVLFADLFTYCPGAVVSDIPAAPASGVVTFTGTWVDRYAVAAITADILIPQSCGFCACSIVETALDSAGLDATCNPTCNGSNQCECTLSLGLVIDEAGSYTASGNTLTIGNGQTFDYCITGDDLQYVETTPTDPEPGLYTLTRP